MTRFRSAPEPRSSELGGREQQRGRGVDCRYGYRSDVEANARVSDKVRRLSWISIIETISFVALLAAMFVHNEGAISVIGAIHGILFLGYAFFLWLDYRDLGWSTWFAIGCIVTGPVGAIIVLERLRRDRTGAHGEATG